MINTPLAGYAGFLSDKQRKDVQNGSGVRHAIFSAPAPAMPQQPVGPYRSRARL